VVLRVSRGCCGVARVSRLRAVLRVSPGVSRLRAVLHVFCWCLWSRFVLCVLRADLAGADLAFHSPLWGWRARGESPFGSASVGADIVDSNFGCSNFGWLVVPEVSVGCCWMLVVPEVSVGCCWMLVVPEVSVGCSAWI